MIPQNLIYPKGLDETVKTVEEIVKRLGWLEVVGDLYLDSPWHVYTLDFKTPKRGETQWAGDVKFSEIEPAKTVVSLRTNNPRLLELWPVLEQELGIDELLDDLRDRFPNTATEILLRYKLIIEEINRQIDELEWLSRTETMDRIEKSGKVIWSERRVFDKDLAEVRKTGLIKNSKWFKEK